MRVSIQGARQATNACDAFGRVTQIASPQGYLNYGYDNVGRVNRTWTSTSSTGAIAITDTTYSYDVLGRLKTVTAVKRNSQSVSPSEVMTYTYDKVGNLDYQEWAKGTNSILTDYTYDALNRLTRLQHYGPLDVWSRPLLAEYVYTVETDGKRSREVETISGRTFDWVYDELGRLVEETYDGPGSDDDFVASYAFDLASNRLQLSKDKGNADPLAFVADEVIDYLYDANDRLLVEELDGNNDSIVDQTTVYKYGEANERTEQTQKTLWDGDDTDPGTGTKLSETTYAFNVRGRLESVAIDSDGIGGVDRTHTYKYNDPGIRVSAHDSATGQTTIYHVDPSNHTGYAQVLEEGVDDDGDGRLDVSEIDKTYTIGHDVIAQQAPAIASGQSLYFGYDGHGSTRILVTPSGTIAQRFVYDAYGNLQAGTGITSEIVDAFTSLLYSGEKTDVTGLQYLRNRYLDPRTGRFISFDAYAGNTQDPISLHKYLYAHGSPTSFIDPSGFGIDFDGEFPLQAHALFAGFAVLAGLTSKPEAPLSELLPKLFSPGDPGAKLAPDALDLRSKKYYELKPVSHKNSPALQKFDAAQLLSYKTALGPHGFGAGDQLGLVPSAIPIGEVVDGGETYIVMIEAAPNPSSGGHDAAGLIYYWGVKKPPQSPTLPFVAVPDNVQTQGVDKQTIRLYEPSVRPLAEQETIRIAAFTAVGALTTVVVVGVGLELASMFNVSVSIGALGVV